MAVTSGTIPFTQLNDGLGKSYKLEWEIIEINYDENKIKLRIKEYDGNLTGNPITIAQTNTYMIGMTFNNNYKNIAGGEYTVGGVIQPIPESQTLQITTQVTFDLPSNGDLSNTNIGIRYTSNVYGTSSVVKTFSLPNSSNGHIKINNTWKNAFAWVKVNGIWKRCLIWQKINGIWKKGK